VLGLHRIPFQLLAQIAHAALTFGAHWTMMSPPRWPGPVAIHTTPDATAKCEAAVETPAALSKACPPLRAPPRVIRRAGPAPTTRPATACSCAPGICGS
jgi:hypothetical protein